MALSDFWKRKEDSAPVIEYVGVGDIVVFMTPNMVAHRGMIAETDADTQLVKVVYLQGNRLQFAWMSPEWTAAIN